jgi:hypothetical protein
MAPDHLRSVAVSDAMVYKIFNILNSLNFIDYYAYKVTMLKRVYLWPGPRTAELFISGPGQFHMLWTTKFLIF